ncbi:hypothetical protein [Halomarina oriensis]|uniref:Uncharacterized protein n=1 Tax=Halomarina oriensis TaxID=671145 RepID=A0A6B0GQC3_9EURY|nr:hypothetical protein [Halomarina oriensis]MWG36271.1 hypothetical protein [Halomarina oriensis]
MSSLDAIRRPEHTGDRRCWPCTLVNGVAVLATAFLVARRRRGLGLVVAVLGGVLVWLRGYVVPYTPAFAPRLVAASPLPDDWFHTETQYRTAPEGSDGPEAPGTLGADAGLDGEETLSVLLDAGAVEADDDGIRLTPTFEEAWRAEMTPLADRDTEALAASVGGVVPDRPATVVEGIDDEWVVLGDGTPEETWLSRPVAVAELAAVRALDGVVSADVARQAAGPLRMFLSTCPDCGTPVVESTTATCCGGYTTPLSAPDDVLACPSCQLRLFTFGE